MLSKDQFYGGALYLTKDTLYGVPARTIDISGRTQVILPSRTGLHPGGPFFHLINTSGGSIPVKNPGGGSTIVTSTNNTVTTILLGTSKWVGFVRAFGNKVRATNGSYVRTIPVGQVTTIPDVIQPTSYDPILCTGGYRRARSCGTGAKANIWMPDSDVSPNFVGGVVAVKYRGQCFYFKESDRLQIGHGTTLAAADVTFYDTCELCQASLMCDPNNPNLPPAVTVRVSNAANEAGDFNGVFELRMAPGGGEYIADPSQFKSDFFEMHLECTSTGWIGRFGYDLTGTPGGSGIVSFSRFKSSVAAVLPPNGVYPFLDGTGSTTVCGTLGCWNGATFEVLGFSYSLD